MRQAFASGRPGEIKNIQIENLYQLIKALDVRFEWLVAGEEPICGERTETSLDIDCLLDMAEAVEAVADGIQNP